jgi:hypothetical protein
MFRAPATRSKLRPAPSSRPLKCLVLSFILILSLVYYNWYFVEKTGQYVGYKTLTAKTKLEVYLNKHPDTSWHGQSSFILEHIDIHC